MGGRKGADVGWWVALHGDEASSLVEFAISLPLLVVLVVGIFDFGGAFNQKQEMNNAVREGAHFGASQPANDLCTSCAAPPSVDAIRYLVDSYLLSSKVNDCGLGTAAIPASGPPWIYTANSGCPGTLSLTIDRGVPLTANMPGATVTLLATQVSISSPYLWHFNNVIQLVAPGASYSGISIKTDATAVNMD
jgi:Flp pilus assembly protein TadG